MIKNILVTAGCIIAAVYIVAAVALMKMRYEDNLLG